MAKFFNKLQLGQTNIQQAEQTSLSDVDNAANAKAAQADRSIDMLMGVAGSALSLGSKLEGRYQDNLNAKNKMLSSEEMVKYSRNIQSKIAGMQDIDSISSEEMQSRIKTIQSDFLEGYDESPYRNQLSDDLQASSRHSLNTMMTARDNLHVKKVSDATAVGATNLFKQYTEGTISREDMLLKSKELIDKSMIAHQVPTSNELGIPNEAREKYMILTRKQGIEAFTRGGMVNLGDPINSKGAKLFGSTDYMEMLGVNEGDPEYTKLTQMFNSRGAKADAFNYTQGVNKLKDGLYTSTNQGVPVDIDKQVELFRSQGNNLTAQDEHKLRKEFKSENSKIVTTESYMENLVGVNSRGKKIASRDITIGMAPKAAQAIYEKSEAFILKANGQPVTPELWNTQMADPQIASEFGKYIHSGGQVSKATVRSFEVAAGYGEKGSLVTAKKYSDNNIALMSISGAIADSGKTIEEVLAPEIVSKTRGYARLYNDDLMDEATKKNAIEQLSLNSTSFNSRGYINATKETPVDTEWSNKFSKDAPWTGEDFVSAAQNDAELRHYYQLFKMQGMSDGDAQDKSEDLFKASNRPFEMPNNDEITVPTKHVYLNRESILAFSKDASKFPSLKSSRDTNGWLGFSIDSEVSIKKDHSYGKTGKYKLYHDGVGQGDAFTYEELSEWISTQPKEVQEKIIGEKIESSYKDAEAKAYENRNKKVNRDKISLDERIQNIFDLAI